MTTSLTELEAERLLRLPPSDTTAWGGPFSGMDPLTISGNNVSFRRAYSDNESRSISLVCGDGRAEKQGAISEIADSIDKNSLIDVLNQHVGLTIPELYSTTIEL